MSRFGGGGNHVKEIHEQTFLGAAVAALSLSGGQAFASGGQDTQWATVDNYGLLGIDISVEGGYSFGSSDLTYGQFDDGAGGLNTFGVETGDGFNGKAGVDARFEGGWKFGLNYTGVRTSEDGNTGTFDNSNSATTYPVWNVLGNTTTSYNEISVKTNVNVDMIDLTVGYDIGLGNSALVLTSGVRYGSVEQKTNTDIWCSAFVCGGPTHQYQYSDSLKSDYTGYGPLLGASYTMPISDGGMSVFGSALGSVLFGEQKTSRWDNNGGGTTQQNDSHTAYTVEAQLGASYKFPDHPMTVSAGYQVSYMDGVRDTSNGTSSTGTDHFGDTKDDLLYHGPFARVTFTLP